MRRWLAPEVVQTSAMDCGPASLKALLEGFGGSASYGRLREACQTTVDGTSIDALEEAGNALGLECTQVMVPADHLLLPGSRLLPALVVVQLPGGYTHFVVVWRRLGSWLQVMDPAVGRRWVSARSFRRGVFRHTQSLAADSWHEWACSQSFRQALEARMAALGFQGASLFADAASRGGWHDLAALDASIRMTEALAAGGAVPRGPRLRKLVIALAGKPETIPDSYWSVREDPACAGHILFRAAVLVHVSGRKAADEELTPELRHAIEERPPRAGWEVFRRILHDSRAAPAVTVAGLALASAGVLFQALVFRSLFDLTHDLRVPIQRWWAAGALLGLVGCILALEMGVAWLVAGMGRKLEVGMRASFLSKLPLLGDRYFQSRPTSDMAERGHALHRLRDQPALAAAFVRALFELILTVLAIAWLFPASIPLAVTAAVAAIGIPLLAQPALAARDLRLRTHQGAIMRFHLDGLLGRTAIRAHGAEPVVRRHHDSLLGEWARASFSMQGLVSVVDGAQLLTTLAVVALLLFSYAGARQEPGAIVILMYWGLRLPFLGQTAAAIAFQYPAQRNITLRLLEPLGTPEETASNARPACASTSGARVDFEDVTVRAAGHTILSGVSLTLRPGEHIGIVGPSGAGKSTLVGLLLGWHKPVAGRILIDGAPLDAQSLRTQTAWVDPQVHLWNRSLLANLRYGSERSELESAIENAHLRGVLARLPEGMESRLGEGGALVSGGEGQRVRLGRALGKPGIRLVLLDEPGRGLDRAARRAVLDRAREIWPGQTLFAVTHDVSDTLDLPRVLVVEKGRVIEDGSPWKLAADPSSRYRALLDAEEAVRRGLWSSAQWRRISLRDGKLLERERAEAACRRY
jgi:ATP-binding cassette subfamily B protein